ncbi:hypothetical protein [Natronosalvus vescus]|uniref:hypothetical protein n=1 Tax=Natronosalvus vescus TaxID=2953881 RepID=UPI002090105F|nr:hypothetical protein [Natronosalvus vescus]
MTSIRDLVSGSLKVGHRYCLEVSVDEDGRLLAEHPSATSPMNVLVCEGLEELEEVPPAGPIEVEILGRVVDDRLAGRVVSASCDEPENVDDSRADQAT